MNKKILNLLLVIVLTVTSIIALPAETQAANYKEAYKDALTTTVSGGIYSKYAYIKMKGFSKPVMMVIMNEWDSNYGITSPKASFYYYKKGKVKKVGSISLDGDRDDWKLKRKGKKYVLYRKKGSDKDYFVFKKKKGKIKADHYSCTFDSYQDPNSYNEFALSMKYYYLKNRKEISKKTFKKAIKTTKKVKLKEHFPEREF